MRVLVVGGTGTAGGAVVAELASRGHAVRVLSRSGRAPQGTTGVRGDLVTGEGLEAALDGVRAVVDASNVTTLSRRRATDFFVGSTRRLVAAGRAAGVRHHVLLSIVGVDRTPTGYYRAKVAQEQAVTEAVEAGAGSSMGWSLLRATQFHDFAGQMIARGRVGPLVVVPGMRVRPVAVAGVGVALADAVEAGPLGRLPDLAGPDVMELTAMARAVLEARGERGRVVGVRVPGAAGRALRTGGLLPSPGEPWREAPGTFAEHLQHL